jgi:photosystem II stability/assembly factor-like uncharacterized protein
LSELPAPSSPRGISFADERTGWIVGDQGLILKTTDGGASWTRMPKLTAVSLYTVTAITPTRAAIAIEPFGFGGERSGLFRTVDAGASWDTLGFVEASPALATRPNVTGIAFPDSTTGYVFTIAGQVYKSTDGGATWSRRPTGLVDKLDSTKTNEPLMGSPMFTDALHGWTIGVDDEIFATADGASTWAVLDTGRWPTLVDDPLNGGKLYLRRQRLQGFIMTGSGVLLAIGERGELRRSADSGRTWTMLNAGFTPTFLTSAAFTSRWTGWVAGGIGEIHRTTDAGASWSRQTTSNNETIRDFVAVDSLTAWASTLAGVHRTTDGGATWQYAAVPGFPLDTADLGDGLKNYYGINAVHFIDRLHGWCAGNRGAVYATSDGGAAWTRLGTPPDYPKMLKDIWFADAEHGWTVGALDGGLFATTDGGLHWTRQNPGDVADSGSSGLPPYNAVTFIDNRKGTFVGDRGRAFSTTDGGATWRAGNTGSARTMFLGGFLRVARPADSLVWAAGIGADASGGIVARSTDGGATWTEPYYLLPATIGGTLLGVSFPDRDHGWFVGSNGYVFTYTADASSGVAGPHSAEAASGLLIAPNPARERFTVSFSTGSRGRVRLTLLNPRGEEAALAVDAMLEPGAHAVDVPGAAELPSGVYYLRLDCDGARLVEPVIVQH